MKIKHDSGSTDLTELDLHQLRAGLSLLDARLKRDRKRMEGVVPEACTAIEVELENLKGRPTEPGLLTRMGIELGGDTADPAQRDIESAVNHDSHALTTEQLRAHIAAITHKHEPKDAVEIFRQMERGEQERTPRPRSKALEMLRSAASTMERMATA